MIFLPVKWDEFGTKTIDFEMMKECKTISINNVLWQYKAINSRGFESPTFRKTRKHANWRAFFVSIINEKI